MLLGRAGVYAALWSAEWNSLDLLVDAQVNAGMSELVVHVSQPLLTADDTGLGLWRFSSPFVMVYARMVKWFDATEVGTDWTRYHRLGGQSGWFAEQGDPSASPGTTSSRDRVLGGSVRHLRGSVADIRNVPRVELSEWRYRCSSVRATPASRPSLWQALRSGWATLGPTSPPRIPKPRSA